MLIDPTYFTSGPRHITNASLGTMPNANATEVGAAIMGYVDAYQERFLAEAVGRKYANKIHDYLLCLEEGDKVSVEAYDEICQRLKEAFAEYVFFHILGQTSSQATITGLVRLKCANTYVSPHHAQIQAWNRMADRMQDFVDWCAESTPLDGIETSSELTTYLNILNI